LLNLSKGVHLATRARLAQLNAERGEQRPTARTEWYRVQMAAEQERATILVYGDIGGWYGVDADQLVREVHALDVKGIDLHINSQGGSMFDGFAIYAAFRNHPAQVTAWIDGVAASAASVIAMAGDEIVIEKMGRIMIHDAGMYASGNAADLREAAQLLDDFSASVAECYADRSGGTPAAFRQAMLAETWYGAAQAVQVGLADRVNGTTAPPENLVSRLIRARARVALGGVSTT
jgi:ATP-dependent protease ClpP protease subunit